MARKQVSVSSDSSDPVLLEVQGNIANEILVIGPDSDIEDRLRERLTAGKSYRTLDLVSHSAGTQNLLLLGDGAGPDLANFLVEAVTGNLWMERLCGPTMTDMIRGLHIKRIRLLGCLTACEELGRATMNSLKSRLGQNGVRVEVYGTKRLLAALDFDQDGFMGSSPQRAALVSCKQMNRPGFKGVRCSLDPPPGAPSTLELDLNRVPPLQSDELEQLTGSPAFVGRSKLLRFGDDELNRLYEAVGDAGRSKGRSISGLLTLPTWEYWIEVPKVPDAPNRYRLLQVLFNWRMLRVYSHDLMAPHNPFADPNNLLTNSAIYRVENPTGFRQVLTSHEPQVPVHPRRKRPTPP